MQGSKEDAEEVMGRLEMFNAISYEFSYEFAPINPFASPYKFPFLLIPETSPSSSNAYVCKLGSGESPRNRRFA